MIAFILWREFRLSIAEIYNFFSNSNCVFVNQKIAIFEWISKQEVLDNFYKLGWSIKVIEVTKELKKENDFIKESIHFIENQAKDYEGKFNFALASYSEKSNVFTTWIQIKKELKKSIDTNLRFVNKDNSNINAAVYKKELMNWVELNYIETPDKLYIWNTIAYQDIDNYSERDYGKSRDMQVWMLPPKLAQMMINLSRAKNQELRVKENKNLDSQFSILNSIYDPFCWLWTVLIEAAISWYRNIIGSDLSEKMVEASNKNIRNYIDKWMDVDISTHDAMKIWELDFLKNSSNITIVSEWYLGNIMTKWHVTEDKIKIERKNLSSLYEKFFSWLKKLNFKWPIVISFPFWQFKWKYYYFEEIYDIFKKYWFKPQKLLPENIEFRETRSWSLLYHRPNQQVWREIFCLKLEELRVKG